jgi:hypothetical protein
MCMFEIGSRFITQAGLKLTVLLTQPLECWDYRYIPSCLHTSSLYTVFRFGNIISFALSFGISWVIVLIVGKENPFCLIGDSPQI